MAGMVLVRSAVSMVPRASARLVGGGEKVTTVALSICVSAASFSRTSI